MTESENHRRCELIDKEIDGTLSLAELDELKSLQIKMLAYRRRMAPLPINELQKIIETLKANK